MLLGPCSLAIFVPDDCAILRRRSFLRHCSAQAHLRLACNKPPAACSQLHLPALLPPLPLLRHIPIAALQSLLTQCGTPAPSPENHSVLQTRWPNLSPPAALCGSAPNLPPAGFARRKYPRATLVPPMYASPTTPTGTTFIARS